MSPVHATDAALSARHILILKPSSMGDIVHTLPAVAALRRHYPKARMTWMVNAAWAPLLEKNADINDVLIFPRADFRGVMGWWRFHRWRCEIARSMMPDLILDFQGLLRSALIARSFRKAIVYGLSDAREGARFFYTKTVFVDRRMHAVERYLALAAAAAADSAGALSFPLPQGKSPHGVLPSEPWVLLHPFSRGHGKSLSAEAIMAFCREIKVPVIMAGRGNFTEVLPHNAHDMLNQTTLHELMWLLRHAAYVVSVDSGPMHLAAAVTNRVLGIHAWSDPCRVGPYRSDAHVWRGGAIFHARDEAASSAGDRLPSALEAAALAHWVRNRIYPT